ncbi:TlpA disulfide reductase family protein [Flavobacterium sp. 38-13]|uniref:TlpA family protein disulfide reductase n=1 Tax=Flavobacterium sp. 38-13 TaxID=1896168 RepID=UPI000A508EE6|nr:TlpA disulfide reductase family protein [Flavobacterium sp. 38-13]
MKISKIYLPLLMLVFAFGNTNLAKASSFASISGTVWINGLPADSISFRITPEFIYNKINSNTVTVKCDNQGRFSFRRDVRSDMERLDITIWGNGTRFITNQLINAGDRIYLSYSETSYAAAVKFTGNGSPKYNCSYAIQNVLYPLAGSEHELLPLVHSKDLNGMIFFNRLIPRTDKREKLAEKIIDLAKDSIPPLFAKMIKADVKGYFAEARMRWFIYDFAYSKGSAEVRQLFETESRRYLDTADAAIISRSPNQIKFLYRLAVAKLMFDKGSESKTIYEICQKISSEYSGTLREKVLTFYLLASPDGDSEEYEGCLKNAANSFKSKTSVHFLRERLISSYSKRPLMDFAMPDSTGKIRKISEFKGKVVVIDFWFTNCVPCVELSKNLKENILPLYKSEKEIVFITINLDKYKKTWMKSLKSGLYTSYRSIDLFSGGVAFEHPFVKHYGLQGAPYLFLVNRQGILLDSNLSKENKNMVDQINKALYQEK